MTEPPAMLILTVINASVIAEDFARRARRRATGANPRSPCSMPLTRRMLPELLVSFGAKAAISILLVQCRVRFNGQGAVTDARHAPGGRTERVEERLSGRRREAGAAVPRGRKLGVGIPAQGAQPEDL